MSRSPGSGKRPDQANRRGYRLIAAATVLIGMSWLTVKGNRPISDALAIAAAVSLIAGIVQLYWYLLPRRSQPAKDQTDEGPAD